MITIVEPGFEIKADFPGIAEHIEWCGRHCYQSMDKIKPGSAGRFIRNLVKRGHESVLEHSVITALIICSRACSHQLVRHRIAAYSQESQRFCDYGKLGLRVICPPSIGIEPGSYMFEQIMEDKYGAIWQRNPGGDCWDACQNLDYQQQDWLTAVDIAYEAYLTQRDNRVPPEDARFVLPNACKTSVVSTFNLRMWRHIFQERALNRHAQWEIRGIFGGILDRFVEELPMVFEDLTHE